MSDHEPVRHGQRRHGANALKADKGDELQDGLPASLTSDPSRELAAESQRLVELCSQAGIDVDQAVSRRLIRYLDLVLEKNKLLNLTAVREWDKALVLHLVDSLTLLEEFDKQPQGLKNRLFLDMGCGAGFPGIPLALARPERRGMLCDSVKKKIKAVDEFIAALGLGEQLQTSSERLETLGMTHRRSCGCVVARAVGSLPVLIEYATPILSRRGRLVVSKGVPEESELEAGLEAAELCGLELMSQRLFDLPQGYGQRTVLTYEKVAEPTVALPRAVGAAHKQPLA